MAAGGAAAVLGALVACRSGTRAPGARPGVAAPLALEGDAARITVVQRNSAPVPGSSGRLQVHLGDITRGQVEVTLSRVDGGGVLPPTSAREGDSIRFTYEGHPYRLRMIHIANLLVGDDYAELGFSADSAPSDDPRALIERLLIEVRMADVLFIRNGAEHGPEEAAAHLDRKWKDAGDEVRTPEDFIQKCASRSALSGEPYTVRLRDGTVLSSEAWLSSVLEELRAGRN